jgi:hypothetical protein
MLVDKALWALLLAVGTVEELDMHLVLQTLPTTPVAAVGQVILELVAQHLQIALLLPVEVEVAVEGQIMFVAVRQTVQMAQMVVIHSV